MSRCHGERECRCKSEPGLFEATSLALELGLFLRRSARDSPRRADGGHWLGEHEFEFTLRTGLTLRLPTRSPTRRTGSSISCRAINNIMEKLHYFPASPRTFHRPETSPCNLSGWIPRPFSTHPIQIQTMTVIASWSNRPRSVPLTRSPANVTRIRPVSSLYPPIRTTRMPMQTASTA